MEKIVVEEMAKRSVPDVVDQGCDTEELFDEIGRGHILHDFLGETGTGAEQTVPRRASFRVNAQTGYVPRRDRPSEHSAAGRCIAAAEPRGSRSGLSRCAHADQDEHRGR